MRPHGITLDTGARSQLAGSCSGRHRHSRAQFVGFPESIAPRIELALAYAEVGRPQDARAMATEILRINLRSLVVTSANVQPYADHGIFRREMEWLRLAGFPR